MYSGFSLSLTNTTNYQNCSSDFMEQLKRNKASIQKSLEDYTRNGILDGSMIQKDWFPQVQADIFISHSHDDFDLAKGFACWLYETFGLTSFIDSCIWGYSNDLLRMIDNDFCIASNNPYVYDYEKRNFSTSHVHMMLQTALYKMIDKTEAFILLDTSNSMLKIPSVKNTIAHQTFSPWIYSEIIASQVMRRKLLSEYRCYPVLEQANFSKINNSLNIKYDIDLSHLVDIDSNDLDVWKSKYNTKTAPYLINNSAHNQRHPLDFLYNIVEGRKKDEQSA